MVGRHPRGEIPHVAKIELELTDGRRFISEIVVRCPVCGSEYVALNGTQARKGTRIQSFICMNPACEFRKGHKKGKQFNLYSSYEFQALADGMLEEITRNYYSSGETKERIAVRHLIGGPLITYLHNKLIAEVKKKFGLNLVLGQVSEEAIAIDETFVKINGRTYYIIIAVGYRSRKVLGLKLSPTRTEADILEVFREAERNSSLPITIVTSDAWAPAISMVKHLNRPITHIIHIHSRPFDKVIINRIEYNAGSRIITSIALKSDTFKRRGRRIIRYMVRKERLKPRRRRKPKQRRRRTLLPKNSSAASNSPPLKKKPGRPPLSNIFKTGKRCRIRVDPYRKKVRIAPSLPNPIATALNHAINLFHNKFIQNNLAENFNSILARCIRLNGPGSLQRLAEKLRVFCLLRNYPSLSFKIKLKHRFNSPTIRKNLLKSPLKEVLSACIS